VYHFIDESGSFSWHNPGLSLFASLLVPDRSLSSFLDRFGRWKRNIIGQSNRELKGSELTDKQLESFSYKVLPNSIHEPLLTIVGADTTITSKAIVERHRDQVGDQIACCARMVHNDSPSKKTLIDAYTEMSGWVRKRSAENVLWVHALEESVEQTVQHSAMYFVEPEDDPEFENSEIVIDRSFISRERHITFWKEWLRNGLMRPSRSAGFKTVDTWSKRDHPFNRKYRLGDGLLTFKDLYQKHTRFDDSKKVLGLQVADICAHICYRFYREKRDSKAYWNLRRRIVGEGGRPITVVHLDERCLYNDAPENHVGWMDIESMKRHAAERKAKRVAAGLD
jgi:hypothetical protein